MLTRGNTLLPVVLLLGGPNCYIKGMRDCWKAQHSQDLGRAQHSAARRRSARGPDQDSGQRAVFRRDRQRRIRQDRRRQRRHVRGLQQARVVHQRRPRRRKDKARRRRGLTKDEATWRPSRKSTAPRSSSRRSSSRAKWLKVSSASMAAPPPPRPCCCPRITSGASCAKTYQLSKGNPIEDTMEMLQKLDQPDSRSGRRR